MPPRKPKEPDIASRQGTRMIDTIRQHYSGERHCITVPEWGDAELWFPPITSAVLEAVEMRDPKTNLDRQMLMLVNTASDKGGKPLFEYGDIHHLRQECELSVLQRVFDFMLSSWLNKQQAEKKVNEDPT